MSLSAPSLPHAAKALSHQLQQDKVEDVARSERRVPIFAKAQKEKEHLEEKNKKKRADCEKARKLEKLQTWKRMQVDKEKRETRWTQKMEKHAFHVDLWAEDEALYVQNRISDSQTSLRERATDKAVSKDQADRRKAKVGEVDQLDILRKEKKKLQEDQKELKARLDLDKVNQRCEAAQDKADVKVEALQCKRGDLGLLDRSHSDFFTEPRLNSASFDTHVDKKNSHVDKSVEDYKSILYRQEDCRWGARECQWVKTLQSKNSDRMSISMRSTAAGTTEEQWWPVQELDQVMLADPDPTMMQSCGQDDLDGTIRI